MVNLMDPVPLAVIVLIITSAIIAVVVLTTSGKNTAEKPASTGSRTVERKSPVTPKTPPIADEVSNNTKSFDTIPSAKAVQGNEQETLSVDEDYTKDLEDEKVNSVRITPVAAEEPAVEKSEEKQTQQTGHFEQDVVSDEPILGNEPETINTTGIEGSIANDDYNEIPVDSEIEEQNAQDGDKKASDEGELGEEEREEKVEQAEPEVEPEAEAEVEEEEVGQYDESEYNPDDNNQDYYEDQDGREEDGAGSENEGERRSSLDYATGLSLDTSHSAHTSSATTPRSKSSLTPSADPSGGLSPMKNSSAYKFGSHYQHKKVGASWVKDSNSQASAAAASPVTVSPMRHSQPRKVIPESDQDKPLSTKQSTKISQYEEGLQAEKAKVSSKVLETRRRTIEDVITRVLLDGEVHLPSELDPTTLIVDPAEVIVDVKTKKIVKEMKAKFDTSDNSSNTNTSAAGGRSTSVDYNN